MCNVQLKKEKNILRKSREDAPASRTGQTPKSNGLSENRILPTHKAESNLLIAFLRNAAKK